MTKLEELKERLNAIPKDYFDDCEGGEITGGVDFELLQLVSKDVPWLIAEVERLRAALRTVAAHQGASCDFCGGAREADDWETQNHSPTCEVYTPDGEVK